MELHRLPAEEAAVRRYVEELWLPFHRDLEAIVSDYALADDVDLVEAEAEFRLDRLEEDGYRLWIAVDGVADPTDGSLTDVDGEFVGFVGTEIDEPPSVFDRPDRLVVGDIYVRERYRGTGLAGELMDRAVERAREAGCGELALDVDVGNERAIGFYEKLGFEPHRWRMMVDVDDL